MVLAMIVFSAANLRAQAKPDFATHPYFKHLVGDWEAAGDLQAQDGNVLKIKETWKGTMPNAGTFSIEGTREINENKSDYRWTITFNDASGTYEVKHEPGGGGETQRFEGSLSEVTLTMELSAQLGGGSMIKLVERFTGEGHDTLETEVTFTNDKGETTLSGKVINKRVKKE